MRANQSSKSLNESFKNLGRVCIINWKFEGTNLSFLQFSPIIIYSYYHTISNVFSAILCVNFGVITLTGHLPKLHLYITKETPRRQFFFFFFLGK
jgi:hypothetical protein